MNAASLQRSLPSEPSSRANGLFRAVLAGPGHSLADAFENLERLPASRQIVRHGRRKLVGARVTLEPQEGAGYWEFTKIGAGIYVVVENLAYHHSRVELVPGDGLLQFYFKLSGDLTIGVSRAKPLRINRPSLLVYRQPRGIDVEEWTTESAHERCVAITLDSRYLIEELFDGTEAVPPSLQALLHGDLESIQYSQIPLSAPMFELAARLVDNPYSGTMGLIYTEAVTFELLCLAVSGFQGSKSQDDGNRYNDRELRSLHAARAVLMKQFSPPPTIRHVARTVGINETSLKRGFKAVFGETIFDFSVRCRMEHALTLLRERRMPVARVAEAVGYSHQTSFATAFRRHFGVCPKDTRPLGAR